MTLYERFKVGALVDGSNGFDLCKAGVNVDFATRQQMLLSTRYSKRAQYVLSGTSGVCAASSSVSVTWPTLDFIPFVDYQRISIGAQDYYTMWEGDEFGGSGVLDYNDVTASGATFRNWATNRSCYFIYTLYRVEAS